MKKLFLTIGFAAGTLMLAAQPQVVAHRGFHAAEGSWENTVSSLRNAQKLGVYGVEFDVNMTADDSLIVYHGPKILDTKLHAQKNRFAEIRAVKLPGGLEIPTLREFFAQGQKDPSTKLILEIKKHATPQRETQVVEAILRLRAKCGSCRRSNSFRSAGTPATKCSACNPTPSSSTSAATWRP